MVRIAHATDIHWFVPPSLRELSTKRLLGSANLYLAGRRHHFSRAVQDALVAAIVAESPDVVVISGDLTATALPAEFEVALAALQPILQRFPTLIVPGNHDVYTRGAQRDHRIARWFGAWMHGGSPESVARLDVGDVCLLGIDPNRPTGLDAAGFLPEAAVRALAEAVADLPPARACVVVGHYPLADRHGALYDRAGHGLRNAGAVVAAIGSGPRAADLYVHGHVHHGYRTLAPGTLIPTFNPGSGGYAHQPEARRAACFGVYDVSPGSPPEARRLRWDGERFADEAGGAWASGR
jgi:3',5'-cyclic AMP phosphodiesterase CpdA